MITFTGNTITSNTAYALHVPDSQAAGTATIEGNTIMFRWADPDEPGTSGVREPRRPVPTAGPTAEALA